MKNQKIVLEPKTQAFVDALAAQGGKPIYQLSYADARKVLEDAQASASVTKLPADVEDKVFPVGPSGQTSVTIYRPKGSKGRSEEHTSELQSLRHLVCRLLLEKK